MAKYAKIKKIDEDEYEIKFDGRKALTTNLKGLRTLKTEIMAAIPAIPEPKRKMDLIIKYVSEGFGITPEFIYQNTRKRQHLRPRQIAYPLHGRIWVVFVVANDL